MPSKASPSKVSPASKKASAEGAPETTPSKKPKRPNCLRHTRAICNGFGAPFNVVFMLPGLFVVNAFQHFDGLDPFFGVRPDLSFQVLPDGKLMSIKSTEVFCLIAFFTIMCMLTAATYFVSCIKLFADERGTMASEDPPHRLVVQGSYRYVRHPFMLSMIVLILCESVLLGLYSLAIYAVLYWLYCACFATRWEDTELAERFPVESKEYKANVPAWCPRFTPWNPALLQV